MPALLALQIFFWPRKCYVHLTICYEQVPEVRKEKKCSLTIKEDERNFASHYVAIYCRANGQVDPRCS